MITTKDVEARGDEEGRKRALQVWGLDCLSHVPWLREDDDPHNEQHSSTATVAASSTFSQYNSQAAV